MTPKKFSNKKRNKSKLITCIKLCSLGILILGLLLASSGCIKPKQKVPTKESLDQRFSEFKIKYAEKESKGYNLTESKKFAERAMNAYDKGDYELANELLDNAFKALETAKIKTPVTLTVSPTPTQAGESWIKDGPIYIAYPYDFTTDGSFKGITQKIPDLKELGINTIYLMPIWEHEGDKEHPYGITDYYKINPEYGTEEDLHNLVKEVHNNNMKILFDLVTSYTPKSSWIYKNHPDWLIHDKSGNILNAYPNANWGPAIDHTNPEVIDYFVKVAKYYVQEYDIDGWRIDAPQNNYNPKVVSGDHSSTEMLRQIKKEITSIKPNAVLLSESPGPLYWGSPDFEPLFDEMCEASYSYAFSGLLRIDTTGLPKTIKNVKQLYDYYGVSSLRGLYSKAKFLFKNGYLQEVIDEKVSPKDFINFFVTEPVKYNRSRVRFLETQDTARVHGAFPKRHKALLVLISSIPGIPMIRAGQEIGEVDATMGHTVDWANGNSEIRDFYKKVFEIRKKNDALKYGNIKNVWSSGDYTFAYLRSYKDNHVISVINLYSRSVSSKLSLPINELTIDTNAQYQLYDALNNENFNVKGSDLSNYEVKLPAYGSRILILKKQ